jgi:hypothetical protein
MPAGGVVWYTQIVFVKCYKNFDLDERRENDRAKLTEPVHGFASTTVLPTVFPLSVDSLDDYANGYYFGSFAETVSERVQFSFTEIVTILHTTCEIDSKFQVKSEVQTLDVQLTIIRFLTRTHAECAFEIP